MFCEEKDHLAPFPDRSKDKSLAIIKSENFVSTYAST